MTLERTSTSDHSDHSNHDDRTWGTTTMAEEEVGQDVGQDAEQAQAEPPAGTSAHRSSSPASSPASSTASTRRGRSPRRGGDHTVEELAAQRRELERLDGGLTALAATVGHNAGLLAETVPRVADLATALNRVVGRVDDIAGAADDPTDGEDTEPDTGPYDDDLLTTHGLLPDPGHQVDWHLMSAEQARPAWEALAAWVATVLCGRLGFTRAQLPDCWALHPDVVAELSWAHQLHRAYAGKGVGPPHIAEWHTRWLPHLHARLGALLPVDALDPRAVGCRRDDRPEDFRPRCRPGHYHQLTLRRRELAERDLEPQCANDATRDAPPPAFAREHGDQSWITGLLAPQYGPPPTGHDLAARDRRRYRAQAALDGAEHPTGSPERARYLAVHPGDDHPVIGSPAVLRADPRHWLGYYREAAHADLARRRHRDQHPDQHRLDVTLDLAARHSDPDPGQGEGRSE